MPKRSINSTDRKPIPRDVVDITMLPDEGSHPRARAILDIVGIARMKFDADALVVLEANRGASLVRFDCGTVGRLSVPPILDMSSMDPGGAISFRVKVVKKGVIRGLSPKIMPREEGENSDRLALLPVRYVDLGQRISMVSGGLDEPPRLLLNKNIPGIEIRWQGDPLLKGTIVLAAVESILGRLAEAEPQDDPDDWRNQWLRYCREKLGTDEFPVEGDEEDKRSWADVNLRAFADHAGFVGHVLDELEKAGR